MHDYIISNSSQNYKVFGVRDKGTLYYIIHKIIKKIQNNSDPVEIASVMLQRICHKTRF